MLREYGLPLSSIVGATVGALLIAKVVLITDKFPFINRFPGKPLIYNVAWKTAIYMAAAVLIHYLEHLVPIWWRTGDLATANRHLTTEIVWPHFWAIQLWLIVLLFVPSAARKSSTYSSDAAPPEFSSGYRTKVQFRSPTWTG